MIKQTKNNVDTIKSKVKTLLQLPAIPKIAHEIVELTDNPQTSALKLAKIISTDQGLTSKVLKIANSPFYGFPKKISTIEFAVVVLGFDSLKEIVISISLMSAVQKQTDNYLDHNKFWNHSIKTAAIARRLARDLGYRISGEVFVAGLLHDMGISVLHRYFEKEFKSIITLLREENISSLDAEKQILETTHAEIGGWLAERWNLPDQLIEAITYHHKPEEALKNPELVAIVHCADVIANKLENGDFEFDQEIDFNNGALNVLNITDVGVFDQYHDIEYESMRGDSEDAKDHNKKT